MMFRRCLALGLAIAVLTPTQAHADAAGAVGPSIRLGVITDRPRETVQARLQPLADYLGKALDNRKVEIVPLDFDEMDANSTRYQIDFLLTSPPQYVRLKNRNTFSGALATLVDEDAGRPLRAIGGTIVARSDRADIATLADLARQRIAIAHPESLGGYQAQVWALRNAGLPLPPANRILVAGLPQERVIDAVLRGEADAGFVLAGVLEELVRMGRIEAGALKVINEQALSDFPYRVSTYLHPAEPFVALPHVGEDLSRRVTSLLLSMPRQSGPDGTRYSFTIPADYGGIEDMMRELRLPPFDAPPDVRITDIWRQYRAQIVAGAAAGLVILGLVLALWGRNRQLATSRRRVEQARQRLEHERAFLQQMIDAIPDHIFFKDRQFRYLGCNRSFSEDMVGVPPADVLGRTDFELLRDADTAEARRATDSEAMNSGAPTRHEEVLPLAAGTEMIAETVKVPFRDAAGNVAGVIGISRDISDRRRAEDRIRHLAQHDLLTGLPNRALFADRVENAIAAARREHTLLGLLLIDLDHFKAINDTLGHAIGDAVLTEVGHRLRSAIRESDTAARLGGDEFVILLRTIHDEADALNVAEKVRQAVKQPFELDGQRLSISVSVGVALYPLHGEHLDALSLHADQAMYRMKEAGRDAVGLYQPDPAPST
ncbi:MAG: diguanylate cyclase [Thauera sp.]|nr:diguanylate cyclase [Thauera sp.]